MPGVELGFGKRQFDQLVARVPRFHGPYPCCKRLRSLGVYAAFGFYSEREHGGGPLAQRLNVDGSGLDDRRRNLDEVKLGPLDIFVYFPVELLEVPECRAGRLERICPLRDPLEIFLELTPPRWLEGQVMCEQPAPRIERFTVLRADVGI